MWRFKSAIVPFVLAIAGTFGGPVRAQDNPMENAMSRWVECVRHAYTSGNPGRDKGAAVETAFTTCKSQEDSYYTSTTSTSMSPMGAHAQLVASKLRLKADLIAGRP